METGGTTDCGGNPGNPNRARVLHATGPTRSCAARTVIVASRSRLLSPSALLILMRMFITAGESFQTHTSLEVSTSVSRDCQRQLEAWAATGTCKECCTYAESPNPAAGVSLPMAAGAGKALRSHEASIAAVTSQKYLFCALCAWQQVPAAEPLHASSH
jgi:hypothetical protein